MKVLLANPPWRLDQANVYSQTGAIFPPLGLASIAAVLRREGRFPVEILDAWGLGMGLDRFREEIRRRRPEVVGITAYTTTVVTALETAAAVKSVSPEIRVVLGGPHPTVRPDEVLARDEVDFVVRGEGEIAFPDLLRRMADLSHPSPAAPGLPRRDAPAPSAAGADFSGIPGVSFKRGGKAVHNPGQSFVADLDAIPWPWRDGLPMEIYRPSLGAYKRLPAASVITSRGCPFACTFCSGSIFGRTVRRRSPENVLGEIGELTGRFGIREIYFADDCFTLDRELTAALCDLILGKRLDLTWICSTRVNLVDEPLLRLMKKAGCVSIAYGVESADEKQLQAMKKGITLKEAKRVIALTRRIGMEVRASYIFGLPGEDRASLERTLRLAIEINSDFVIFNIATPRPGTELYDDARARGLLIADGFDLYPLTDSAHGLIRLDGIAPAELEEFYRRAYRRYYFRPRYVLSRLARIRSIEDVRHHWRGMRGFFRWRSKNQ